MKRKTVTCPYCLGKGSVKNGTNEVVCQKCNAYFSYSHPLSKVEFHVSGNNHKEVEEVASSLSKDHMNDKTVKLKELESEYDLAKMGLIKGIFVTFGAIFAGLITFGGSLYAFLEKGPGFISGEQLIILFSFMIVGLVIYFSFVFGRAAKLRMAITKTKKELEVSSGENVRK